MLIPNFCQETNKIHIVVRYIKFRFKEQELLNEEATQKTNGILNAHTHKVLQISNPAYFFAVKLHIQLLDSYPFI